MSIESIKFVNKLNIKIPSDDGKAKTVDYNILYGKGAKVEI